MFLYKKLWNESQALLVTCIVMLIAFVGSVAGLFLDSRIITGAAAWLKPAKFAISTLIFAASIAWLFQYLTVSSKLKRYLGGVLSFALVLEVGIIDLQAARGITSHFNVGTPLDRTLFSVMGLGIGVLWVCMVWITVLLFRQRFADVAFGWALRLGMTITVLGASAGGMMLPPNHQQIVQIEHREKLTTIGAHTVGAPDGGEGLPVTEWSARHGDLRIPHFFGLHALQIVPFCAWLLLRRRKMAVKQEIRCVFSLAASYLVFIAILMWQALRGQSVAEPGTNTLVAICVWLAASLAALAWSRHAEPSPRAVSHSFTA
jgi:hypothetical protein